MSRRLNRDPLPLHKPEACSKLLQWPDLARGGYLHSNGSTGSFDDLFMGM